jgi:anaerobic ribonucleoside-triphosphate reductase activating protein
MRARRRTFTTSSGSTGGESQVGRPSLRIHQFLPASYANGPGRRAVLWVQGCSLGCHGCFNPETHALARGEARGVDEMMADIKSQAGAIEGITVSGGEPLQQLPALLALLERVREETPLSTILFTGYTFDEVLSLAPESVRLLACVDVLIAGRYNHSKRLASGLIGSANKTIHFLTDRYGAGDLQSVPEAEVVITPDGHLLMTGIDPASW